MGWKESALGSKARLLARRELRAGELAREEEGVESDYEKSHSSWKIGCHFGRVEPRIHPTLPPKMNM